VIALSVSPPHRVTMSPDHAVTEASRSDGRKVVKAT
jgi:hypothetical protein